MAGLGYTDPNSQPAVASQPQQKGLPQQQTPDATSGEAASPEEQQQYDEIVTRAKSLIFDPQKQEVRPAIVQSLKNGEPKDALGQTAATVFFRVEQAAAQAGQQIMETVKEPAGEEIFSDLAQVASKVTDVDFMSDDQAYNAAWLIAVDDLRNMEQSAGLINQDQANANMQDMAAADKDGRLAQIMQGIGA